VHWRKFLDASRELSLYTNRRYHALYGKLTSEVADGMSERSEFVRASPGAAVRRVPKSFLNNVAIGTAIGDAQRRRRVAGPVETG
jgi:hypothetical protein